MNTITHEAVKLLGVSLMAAVLINVLSPRGIPFLAGSDSTRGVSASIRDNSDEAAVIEIGGVDGAKEIFDSGMAIFVDARTQDAYDEGHIKGAVSLPLGEFDNLIPEFLSQYPFSKPIVAYCSGRTCRDSHELAQLLSAVGYQDVRVFIDGYPAWKKKKYPDE